MIKRGEISRGYDDVRENLVKNKKYLASCENCYFFKNGVCTNPNVTEYDMCEDNGRVWCSYWEVYKGGPTEQAKKDEKRLRKTAKSSKKDDVPW